MRVREVYKKYTPQQNIDEVHNLFIPVSRQNKILPVRSKKCEGSTHFAFENYTMLIWEEHISKEFYENPKKLIVQSTTW
jgi:hypothetical protein